MVEHWDTRTAAKKVDRRVGCSVDVLVDNLAVSWAAKWDPKTAELLVVQTDCRKADYLAVAKDAKMVDETAHSSAESKDGCLVEMMARSSVAS